MKRFKKAVLAGLVCAMCCQTAFAASLSADALYDGQKNKLKITGHGTENSDVTVIILPYDEDETGLTAEKANAGSAIFNMAYLDATGNFDLQMGLKSGWKSGMYKAVIYQGDESVVLWFPYAERSQMTEPLSRINRASAGEIKNILLIDGEKLGADSEIVEKYGDTIANYLYYQRPDDGYGADSFLETYTAGLALGMLKSDVSLTQIVENLSRYIGTDSAEYASYSKAVKTELERLLRNADVKDESIADLYQTYLLLAKINAAESDIALQSVVLENKNTLELSMTAYNNLSTSYQKLFVFTTMRNQTYASYKAVREAFYAACSTAVTTGTQGGSLSGGSSGGIGGGSVSGGGTSGGIYGNVPEESGKPGSETKEPLWDVKGHWGETAVMSLVERGVLSGYPDGRYLPDANVSRAEFSKMICTAMGFGEAAWSNVFYDVGKDDWHAPYVLSLSKLGVVTGFDGRFLPESMITREDAAVILYRAMQKKGISAEEEMSFADAEVVSDYAREAVKKLAGLHVINGYEGRFAPQDHTTRAEAAAMLINMLNVLQAD